MKITKCIYCGSEDITENVKIIADTVRSMTLEVRYKIEKEHFYSMDYDKEPLLADICNSCGSVIRFYVKTPHKNWITGDY
jgi:hypothetical protein